jgi:hypothetical protein
MEYQIPRCRPKSAIFFPIVAYMVLTAEKSPKTQQAICEKRTPRGRSAKENNPPPHPARQQLFHVKGAVQTKHILTSFDHDRTREQLKFGYFLFGLPETHSLISGNSKGQNGSPGR